MSDSTDGSEDDGSSVDYWQVSFAALAVIGLVLAAFVAPPLAGGGPTDDGNSGGGERVGGESGDGSGGGGLIDIIGWLLRLLLRPGDPQPPEEPSEPPCRIALDREPTPGAEVTVQVTADGDPVVDAVVWFNEKRIGRTDERGRVTGRVPYSRELRIRVLKEGLQGCVGTARPTGGSLDAGTASDAAGATAGGPDGPGTGDLTAAIAGSVSTGASAAAPAGATRDATDPVALDGFADATPALQSDEDDNESVTVEVDGRITIRVVERPYPGETVEVVASIDGVPMRRATVSVDGEAVAETGDDGRATITVPEADTIRVGVERGDFAGSRTVDVYLLEVTLEPEGLVLVPGGDATVVAGVADEQVDGAEVSVAGEPVGTTGTDGRRDVTLPADPTAPVVVRTDRQTTGVSLLGLYWLPLLVFGVVTAGAAGVGHRLRGSRGALAVLGVAGAAVVVLVAGGYGGETGALAALAAVVVVALLALLVRYRRVVAGGATSAGGLLAALVERLIGWALWVVGGLERLVDWIRGVLARTAAWVRSLPRSISGLVARIVRGVRSLLTRIAARAAGVSLRATAAAVVSLVAVAGAYWYDGVRGAVVAGTLVLAGAVVWWFLAREDAAASAADGSDAEGDDSTGRATTRPGTGEGSSWTIRELWRRFARRVVPGRWRTRSPAEVARRAVREGYPAGPVRTLATAFREVEYGNRSTRGIARDRIRAAYDALREGRPGDPDGERDSIDEPTAEGDAS